MDKIIIFFEKSTILKIQFGQMTNEYGFPKKPCVVDNVMCVMCALNNGFTIYKYDDGTKLSQIEKIRNPQLKYPNTYWEAYYMKK